jgi:hypothetical protein
MTEPNPYAAPDSGGGLGGWQQPTYPPPGYGQPAAPPPGYLQPAAPPPGYLQPAAPPPGYAQPAYPPPAYGYAAPARPFRGNQGLGTASLILGGAFVGYLLLQALTAPSAIRAYDAAAAQGIDPRSVNTAHDVVGILALIGLPLWIVTAIWLSRARGNAAVLAPAHLRRSAVWCWLGWLVPIVSWWFPKQLVDDSWRITAHQLPGTSRGRYRSTGLWWGLWVAFSVLDGASLRVSVFSSDPSSVSYDPHLGVNPWLEFVVAVLAIAAYAAWVPVALGVSRAQEELKARFTPTGY